MFYFACFSPLFCGFCLLRGLAVGGCGFLSRGVVVVFVVVFCVYMVCLGVLGLGFCVGM